MGHVPAPLKVMSDKIREKSNVWIVLPERYPKGAVEQVVRLCMDRGCNITIISDLPPTLIRGKDLQGVKVHSIFEWLSPDQEAAMVKAACNIAKTWFNMPVIDNLLKWRDIRLGEMLEHLLPTYSLIDSIRLVEGILKWLAKEQPAVVVLMNRQGGNSVAFQQVMEQQGIPIILFSNGTLGSRLAGLMVEAWYKILYGLLDLRDLLIRVIWVKLVHIYSRLRERQGSEESPLAVFVGFAGNHYKHILPIGQELRRRHWRVRILRGLTGKTWNASDGVKQPGLLMGTVDGYVTADIWSRYHTARWQIREMWKHLNRRGAAETSFVYQGVNLWPLLKRHLQYCFFVYLPTAARYMELTWQIIDKERPKVFIFGNDSCSRAHAMIAAARRRAIPTVVVQHGIPAEPWDYVPYSDKMVVWGEYSRNVLLESGAEEEKLICVGAPGFDLLKSIVSDELLLVQRCLEACRRLGIGERRDLILFLTGNEDEYSSASLARITFQAIRDLSLEDKLVIKLHPNETGRIQQKVASEVKFRPLMTRETDLWGLLAASSIVITSLNSTAGVEALILRKPVIAVKTGESQSIYAKTTGLVYEVETKEDLEVCLQELIYGKTKHDIQSLEWFVGPLDGKATSRAVNLIAKMAGVELEDASLFGGFRC